MKKLTPQKESPCACPPSLNWPARSWLGQDAAGPMWSPHGDAALQGLFREMEHKLDDANSTCHAQDEANRRIKATTIEEAHAACADLHAIYLAVSQHPVAIPEGWSSVFRDDAGFKTRSSYGLFAADTLQQKRDEAIRVSSPGRQMLLAMDRVILRSDRVMWLLEMVHEDEDAFKARHPEHPLPVESEAFDFQKQLRQKTLENTLKLRKIAFTIRKPGR